MNESTNKTVLKSERNKKGIMDFSHGKFLGLDVMEITCLVE